MRFTRAHWHLYPEGGGVGVAFSVTEVRQSRICEEGTAGRFQSGGNKGRVRRVGWTNPARNSGQYRGQFGFGESFSLSLSLSHPHTFSPSA